MFRIIRTTVLSAVIGIGALGLLPARLGDVIRPYLLARQEGLSLPAVGATVVFVRPPQSKWIREATPGVPFVPKRDWRVGVSVMDEVLDTYVPGAIPHKLQPGQAKLIPAGSDLVFQLHYTANGKPGTDRSRIGLIFAKEPPDVDSHAKLREHVACLFEKDGWAFSLIYGVTFGGFIVHRVGRIPLPGAEIPFRDGVLLRVEAAEPRRVAKVIATRPRNFVEADTTEAAGSSG